MTLSPALFQNPLDLPVPHDRPFTRPQAFDLGVTKRQLYEWLDCRLLVSPVRGVYYLATIPDSLELRLACLRLIMPKDAVVCDRTAGWVLGAPMILDLAIISRSRGHRSSAHPETGCATS